MTRTKETTPPTGQVVAPFFVADSAVITLGDLWSAVHRYLARVAAVFLAVVALAFGSLYVWPRTYSSEAKLFIKIGRDTATLDPATSASGQAINVLESRQNEINSILEVMRSRELAERTVRRIGADVVLEGRLPVEGDGPENPSFAANAATAAKEWLSLASSWLPRDPISNEEKAVIALQDGMSIGSTRSSSIATISYETETAEAAKHILEVFLEEFGKLHLEVQKTRGSFEFFEDAVAKSDAKVRAESVKLRDAKVRVGAASMDGKRKLLEDELASIRLEMVRARSAVAEAETRAASLKETLTSVPERVVAQETNGIGNAGVENMRDRLYQLEITEAELNSKLSADHPRMVALRKAREDSQKILGSTKDARKHVMTAINTVRQQLEVSLLSEDATLQAARARLRALTEQEQDCLQRIVAFNQDEIELAELQRNVQTAEAAYISQLGRLEQTRTNRDLEEQQITNVNVYQAASLSQKPTSPKKPMVLGLGVAMGMFLGVSTAIVSHASDRTLKTRGDIEAAFDAPVLVNIPKTQWLASRWR